MSEVNGPKFGVNQVNLNGIQRTPIENKEKDIAEEQEAPKLTDFSDPKAEALGRSMLLKTVDDSSHDMKVLLDNPQIVENSDKAFETTFKALKDAGIENPYENAASVSTTSV